MQVYWAAYHEKKKTLNPNAQSNRRQHLQSYFWSFASNIKWLVLLFLIAVIYLQSEHYVRDGSTIFDITLYYRH